MCVLAKQVVLKDRNRKNSNLFNRNKTGKLLIMARKGQPSGFVGNPSGKNQYAEKRGEGKRKERLLLRVTPEFKEKVREAAKQDNQSMTEWLEKVVNAELSLREVKPQTN